MKNNLRKTIGKFNSCIILKEEKYVSRIIPSYMFMQSGIQILREKDAADITESCNWTPVIDKCKR